MKNMLILSSDDYEKKVYETACACPEGIRFSPDILYGRESTIYFLKI